MNECDWLLEGEEKGRVNVRAYSSREARSYSAVAIALAVAFTVPVPALPVPVTVCAFQFRFKSLTVLEPHHPPTTPTALQPRQVALHRNWKLTTP
jgi:hypothetical protein